MYQKQIFYSLPILLLSILVGLSCSKRLHPDASSEVIVYPAPPDTARVQFLTTINSSQDIGKKNSAFVKFVVGEEKPKMIARPYGMHLHKGKLYVCDLGLPGMEIMDLENGTLEYFVPKGLGQIKSPVNCFVDDNDYLYVVDNSRREILVFDEDLKFVNSIGEKGEFKPNDVFVTENEIWVANMMNKIHVYSKDADHSLLRTFPELEKESEGFLYQPTNISVTDDAVYASDFGAFNVKVYDHDGRFLRKIGGQGLSYGQFNRPKGIAVDKDNILYVVDASFENVQMFNEQDQLLMFFGGHYQGPGDMSLPSKIIVDYDNLEYFEKFVDKRYELKNLILVANGYGPVKINVYGRVEHKGSKTKLKDAMASTGKVKK